MKRGRKMFSLGADRPGNTLGLFVPIAEVRRVFELVNTTDMQSRVLAAESIDRWLREFLPRQSTLVGRK